MVFFSSEKQSISEKKMILDRFTYKRACSESYFYWPKKFHCRNLFVLIATISSLANAFYSNKTNAFFFFDIIGWPQHAFCGLWTSWCGCPAQICQFHHVFRHFERKLRKSQQQDQNDQVRVELKLISRCFWPAFRRSTRTI